jgi:hypothetical protein
MPNKAIDIFERISERANNIILSIFFNACAESADDRAHRLGNQVFQQLPAMCKNEIAVTGTVLRMLMKFGQVKDAEELFQSSKGKNLVMYGAMMHGE